MFIIMRKTLELIMTFVSNQSQPISSMATDTKKSGRGLLYFMMFLAVVVPSMMILILCHLMVEAKQNAIEDIHGINHDLTKGINHITHITPNNTSITMLLTRNKKETYAIIMPLMLLLFALKLYRMRFFPQYLDQPIWAWSARTLSWIYCFTAYSQLLAFLAAVTVFAKDSDGHKYHAVTSEFGFLSAIVNGFVHALLTFQMRTGPKFFRWSWSGEALYYFFTAFLAMVYSDIYIGNLDSHIPEALAIMALLMRYPMFALSFYRDHRIDEKKRAREDRKKALIAGETLRRNLRSQSFTV